MSNLLRTGKVHPTRRPRCAVYVLKYAVGARYIRPTSETTLNVATAESCRRQTPRRHSHICLCLFVFLHHINTAARAGGA